VCRTHSLETNARLHWQRLSRRLCLTTDVAFRDRKVCRVCVDCGEAVEHGLIVLEDTGWLLVLVIIGTANGHHRYALSVTQAGMWRADGYGVISLGPVRCLSLSLTVADLRGASSRSCVAGEGASRRLLQQLAHGVREKDTG